MLTSSCQKRDLVESYQLGVNAYVVKSVDFGQFVDAVGKIVSGTAERTLDSIANIAESSTGYAVVGKANSPTLVMAVDTRSGKQRESTQATPARMFHTLRSVINCIRGPPRAKKRGHRIHRTQIWAGGLCASLLALAAVNCRAGETAPVPAESGVAQLKKLSLEELMDIEVTSVSKHPERLSETASAIQVITQEDIPVSYTHLTLPTKRIV